MFDIFFIDSEGIEGTGERRDAYESNPNQDRQRKIISILLAVSSFLIYLGDGLDLEKDLERLSMADESPLEIQPHLLWLLKNLENRHEIHSAQDFIQNLFTGDLQTNPTCKMHASIISQLYNEKYGFKLTQKAND